MRPDLTPAQRAYLRNAERRERRKTMIVGLVCSVVLFVVAGICVLLRMVIGR